MSLGIGAPFGLLGLIGIPVLVALYAIQDRHRRAQITTLFLIEAVSDDTTTARRIDYVRLPLSFWLQLLAIIFGSMLLAQLYYSKFEQYTKVLVLIDGSASMAAFTSKIPDALDQIQRNLPDGTPVEWTLVTSDAPHKILYQGLERSKAEKTLTSWQPHSSGHSLHRALEIARQSAPHIQTIAVITDHKESPINDAITIGIGDPRNTVGFSGGNVRPDGEHFIGEVLIRNYSQEPQTRRLSALQENQAPIEELITLAPGEIRRLSRKLKSDDGDIVLRLEPDDFPLDDSFPMVIPHIRTIKWQLQDGQELFDQIYRLMNRFPHLEEVSQNPALQVKALRPTELSNITSSLPQIQWLISDTDSPESQIHRTNGAVAVNHPLVRSLRFGPLLVPAPASTAIPEDDEVLVWHNNHPIISLGGTRDAPILRVLFDIRYSNAIRLPAFIILIHRFLDDLRSRVVAYEARNVDTSQLISIPLSNTEGKKSVKITTITESRTIEVDSSVGSTIIRSPSKPGFFDIAVEGKSVLHGAASFQDTREADLSKAESFTSTAAQLGKAPPKWNPLEANSVRSEFEGLTPFLIVLTALAIMLSWLYSAPPGTTARTYRGKIQP